MQNNTTRFVVKLNRWWDGKDFVSHRKSSPSFLLANRCLTVSLMLQPLLLEQLTAKNQGIVRQIGFLARSLLGCLRRRWVSDFMKSLRNFGLTCNYFMNVSWLV
jgi:hypothetical protein